MSAAPPEGGGGAAAFPWDEAMTVGFGLLRLSPRHFWAMTPREFARALAAFAPATSDPIDRASLAGLMGRFPDERAR